MNNSLLQSGMLLISARLEKGVSLILPVRLLLAAITNCTMSASARNSSGASNRMAVAQRLRHATSTAARVRVWTVVGGKAGNEGFMSGSYTQCSCTPLIQVAGQRMAMVACCTVRAIVYI
eukprot:GHRQ01018512.1.p1 GENE.GHRQ01018512.1~~GHRQ01018512.1.p1  ORF type:complete len:120 (+),score=9.94 GHRQ01018512.1:532-891(+)